MSKNKKRVVLQAVSEAKEDRYPRIGPFYFYKNTIIMPEKYQRRVNPITFDVEIIEGYIPPGEHRDMWDRYMTIKYPELKVDCDDDHKALPRGRVDYSIKNSKLSFFITLDKCIKGQESKIKSIYNLASGYPVEFHYGTLNYKCKDCR